MTVMLRGASRTALMRVRWWTAAFDALWVYIGEINEALAPFAPDHVH